MSGSTHRRLPPVECARLLREEGYRYLDVRSVPEFEQGHPAGAYNIPLQQPGPEGMQDNPDFLPVVRANFPLDQPLVVGCRSGNRSQTAMARLVDAGYREVVDQRAGFHGVRDPFGRISEEGWLSLELPSATVAEAGHDYAALKAAAPTRK